LAGHLILVVGGINAVVALIGLGLGAF